MLFLKKENRTLKAINMTLHAWPKGTDEQVWFMDGVRDCVLKKIQPAAKLSDASGEFPRAGIQELAKLGLMGMMVEEAWGGAGLSAVSYAMAIEEISAACASTGVIVSVNNSLVCSPIAKYGSDFQKQTFLRPLAQGEKLGCFGLSEPEHGSDPAGLQCQAIPVEGGYRLRGSKNWITNGKEADFCLVFATTDRLLKQKGILCLVVDTHSPGFQVSKLEEKLGIHASSTAQLFFDDVFVPESHRLGTEGQGFRIALDTLDGGRIGIASQALGIARSALESSKAFALSRSQFGAPIAKLQAIQWFIADMATRLQGARLLTWHAARLKDQGEKITQAAAMAKLAASEAAMWITTKAIQVHGGYGYTKEYSVERNFRDAKITEIYEGTSEIQRLVIAAQELAEVQ